MVLCGAAGGFGSLCTESHLINNSVYVLDFDGHVLVHPTLKGQHAIDLQDIDGKMFFRTMIASAQNNGKGWEDYRWNNPLTQGIEQKSAYYERYEDVIVVCGIYFGARKPLARSEPMATLPAATPGRRPRVPAG